MNVRTGIHLTAEPRATYERDGVAHLNDGELLVLDQEPLPKVWPV